MAAPRQPLPAGRLWSSNVYTERPPEPPLAATKCRRGRGGGDPWHHECRRIRAEPVAREMVMRTARLAFTFLVLNIYNAEIFAVSSNFGLIIRTPGQCIQQPHLSLRLKGGESENSPGKVNFEIENDGDGIDGIIYNLLISFLKFNHLKVILLDSFKIV